jgi:hypothetical protein
MRQRGRKSAELLSFPAIDGPRPRIMPPASLTKAERSLFTEIAADAQHLVQADAPLLASYVQAVLLSRRAGRDLRCIDEWEQIVRVMATLATKLRLTPQSRIDAKSLTRGQRPISHYERMALDDQG